MHLKLSTEVADFSIVVLTFGQHLSENRERKTVHVFIIGEDSFMSLHKEQYQIGQSEPEISGKK